MRELELSEFNFNFTAFCHYEIALKNGATIRTDGAADDYARPMEMMAHGVIAAAPLTLRHGQAGQMLALVRRPFIRARNDALSICSLLGLVQHVFEPVFSEHFADGPA